MCAPTARNAASKPACLHRRRRCWSTLRVELELDAHIEDALHFGIEHVARQPVLRNAEAHHAAGERPGLDDRDGVAEAPQVVGRRQSRRSGADDQHALAGLGFGRRESPAVLERLVAEKALDRVDADRLVELAAVARGLARVIADAAHDRGQRIVFASARATPLRSRRTRRDTASPGCSRRRGRRDCTAAGDRRTPAGWCATSRSCWRGSSRRRA